MSHELPGQLPMFDVEPTRTRKAPTPPPVGVPKWQPYKKVRPERCDDCLEVLIANGGAGPRCRSAVWRRITRRSELLLCGSHAQDRRLQDRLPALPAKDSP